MRTGGFLGLRIWGSSIDKSHEFHSYGVVHTRLGDATVGCGRNVTAIATVRSGSTSTDRHQNSSRTSSRVGTEWTEASTGSFVLVPGNVTHDFENRGSEPPEHPPGDTRV